MQLLLLLSIAFVLTQGFGIDGISTVAAGMSGTPYLNHVIRRPNGKTLASFTYKYDTVKRGSELFQLELDGSLDTSFGTNGFYQLKPPADKAKYAITKFVQLKDGRIIGCGEASELGDTVRVKFLAVVMTDKGLEPFFESGLFYDSTSSSGKMLSCFAHPDGGLLFTGSKISKYLEDGVRDSSFGVSGEVRPTDFSFIDSVVVLESGTIVAFGHQSSPQNRILATLDSYGAELHIKKLSKWTTYERVGDLIVAEGEEYVWVIFATSSEIYISKYFFITNTFEYIQRSNPNWGEVGQALKSHASNSIIVKFVNINNFIQNTKIAKYNLNSNGIYELDTTFADNKGFYQTINNFQISMTENDQILVLEKQSSEYKVSALTQTGKYYICSSVQAASTSDNPLIDFNNSGFTSQKSFKLAVNVPTLDGRSGIRAVIGTSELDKCDSLTPNSFWVSPLYDLDNCMYSYEASVAPWNICGFTEIKEDSEDASYTRYESKVLVEYNEEVGTLAGVNLQRTVSNNLYYNIRLKTQVQMTSSVVQVVLSTTSDGSPTAAIVSQILSDGIVNIKLAVAIDYPFELMDLATITLTDQSATATIVKDTTSTQAFCNEDGCLMFYDIQIDTSSQCKFSDSNIEVNVATQCADSASSCYLPTDTTVKVILSVATEDQCPELTDTIEVVGSLLSYSDDSLETPADKFGAGSLAYFSPSFSVFSIQNSVSTALDISTATLEKVEVEVNYSDVTTDIVDMSLDQTTVEIWNSQDRAKPVELNLEGNIIQVSPMDVTSLISDDWQKFSLIVNPQLFSPQGSYYVKATYTIGYGMSKRSLRVVTQQPASKSAQAKSKLSVEEEYENHLLSSANSLFYSTIGIVACFFILL